MGPLSIPDSRKEQSLSHYELCVIFSHGIFCGLINQHGGEGHGPEHECSGFILTALAPQQHTIHLCRDRQQHGGQPEILCLYGERLYKLLWARVITKILLLLMQ